MRMPDFAAAIEQLDRYVRQQMQGYNTPAVSLALTDRRRLLHVAAYGDADLAAGTPAAPEHLFEIGSIGKTFTAVALLQAAEAGRVDLSAPVDTYLPWFRVRSDHAPIAPRHLLSHTSGLTSGTDFAPDPRFEAWSLHDLKTAHAPGEHYHYSNLAFKVLGLLLERVLQRPYAEIVQEQILDPLGMTATAPVITHDTRPRLAVGYDPLYDDRPALRHHPLVPATWVETNTGDGSIASSAADMTAFLRMLLNRGNGPNGRLITSDSFDLLTRPVVEVEDDPGVFYGYGIEVQTVEGRTRIGHLGGMIGYYAAMLGDLDDGFGAVALVNGPGTPGSIARYALSLLSAAARGQQLPPLPEARDPYRVEGAAAYAGVYRSDAGSFAIEAEGERLTLVTGQARVPLYAWDDDTFVADHPAFDRHLLSFGRAGQRVVEALHGGDWYTNAAHAGPARFELPAAWAAYPGHYRAHNPWASNFRVVARKGELWLTFANPPDGFVDEQPLLPLDDGWFGVRCGDYVYDRIRFDTIVDGQALRATLSGADYYRFFTP
jgi:CubicO group peptidase (beta-lactamase class C family)